MLYSFLTFFVFLFSYFCLFFICFLFSSLYFHFSLSLFHLHPYSYFLRVLPFFVLLCIPISLPYVLLTDLYFDSYQYNSLISSVLFLICFMSTVVINSSLKILKRNSRRVLRNIASLESCIVSYSSAIIFHSETGFDIFGFDCFHDDRDDGFGGAVILIRHHISHFFHSINHILQGRNCNGLSLSIHYHNKNILLLSFHCSLNDFFNKNSYINLINALPPQLYIVANFLERCTRSLRN